LDVSALLVGVGSETLDLREGLAQRVGCLAIQIGVDRVAFNDFKYRR